MKYRGNVKECPVLTSQKYSKPVIRNILRDLFLSGGGAGGVADQSVSEKTSSRQEHMTTKRIMRKSVRATLSSIILKLYCTQDTRITQ